MYKLFEQFIGLFTDSQYVLRSIWNNSQDYLTIQKVIISALISLQSSTDKINQLLEDYTDINGNQLESEERGYIYYIAKRACYFDSTLNKEQKKLIENYEKVVPEFRPYIENKWQPAQFTLHKGGGDNIISIYKDLAFQLYLLGNRNTRCYSYTFILSDVESYNFDHFLIQFCDWSNKYTKRGVRTPNSFKKFCIDIIRYVIENSAKNQDRLSVFRTDNLDSSFNKFRWAANDAKKRMRKCSQEH